MEGAENRPPEDPQVVAAKRFVDNYFKTTYEERKHYDVGEFDISRPEHQDMQKIASGDYEISRFRSTPRGQEGQDEGDKKNYHFYIGNTEFHLTGEAADDFDKVKEELHQEPPKAE